MSKTKIEYVDLTINPVVGCSHCSDGCTNCYAERFAARLARHPNPKISGKYAGVVDERGKWTGDIRNSLTNLGGSVNYTRTPPWEYFWHLGQMPKRIFVGSMTDLFHENSSVHNIEHIMRGIHKNPRHTFMFLTKRPIRMREILSPPSSFMVEGKPLPNLWLGVTVCAPDELWKIGELLQTPAAKYFVSFEPLLAHVDPTVIDWTAYMGSTATKNALTGEVHIPGNCGESSQTIQGKKLDWCIVGGETGPGARPMHPDWVRSLRDQCKEAGTPLFFKGWGDFMPVTPDEVPAAWKDCAGFHVACAYGYHEPLHALWYCRAPKPCAGIEHPPGAKCPLVHMRRVGKRRAGRLLDGREWNEVPS